jgi:hypothetical protein
MRTTVDIDDDEVLGVLVSTDRFDPVAIALLVEPAIVHRFQGIPRDAVGPCHLRMKLPDSPMANILQCVAGSNVKRYLGSLAVRHRNPIDSQRRRKGRQPLGDDSRNNAIGVPARRYSRQRKSAPGVAGG